MIGKTKFVGEEAKTCRAVSKFDTGDDGCGATVLLKLYLFKMQLMFALVGVSTDYCINVKVIKWCRGNFKFSTVRCLIVKII